MELRKISAAFIRKLSNWERVIFDLAILLHREFLS